MAIQKRDMETVYLLKVRFLLTFLFYCWMIDDYHPLNSIA